MAAKLAEKSARLVVLVAVGTGDHTSIFRLKEK
jgi:hypothetical protein